MLVNMTSVACRVYHDAFHGKNVTAEQEVCQRMLVVHLSVGIGVENHPDCFTALGCRLFLATYGQKHQWQMKNNETAHPYQIVITYQCDPFRAIGLLYSEKHFNF